MEEKNKQTIKIIAPLISLIIVAIFLMSQVEMQSYKCSGSKFNRFSNSTQATRLFGNCYITIIESYKSTEECGLFGISCYERNEPTTKYYKSDVCFKLKTGELC